VSGVNTVTVSTVSMSMILYTLVAESTPTPRSGKRVSPQSTRRGTPSHRIKVAPPRHLPLREIPLFMRAGGCLSFFFEPGGYPSPFPPIGMKGVPPQMYPKAGGYPIFRIEFHVGEHIFRLFHFGCENLPPTGFLGRGVPVRLS